MLSIYSLPFLFRCSDKLLNCFAMITFQSRFYSNHLMELVIYLTILIRAIESKNEENHNLNVTEVPDHKFHRYGKVGEWANELPILKAQDQGIVDHMRELVHQNEINPLLSEDDFIDHFQRILALPLQTVCNVGKWISLKRWHAKCGSTDGERYLCMDNFHSDIIGNKCLIYSFGISDNYEFEKLMGSVGCTVHAYDPTVSIPPSPANNVYFKKVGLGHYKGKRELMLNLAANISSEPMPMITLKDAFSNNGDLGKEITYLKVDIESSEIKAIPEWIQSGILENVRQIGMELHTGKLYFDRNGQADAAKRLLKLMSQLYDLGFRHISYSPNTCVGKSQDLNGQYYTFIDIVLYKPYISDR